MIKKKTIIIALVFLIIIAIVGVAIYGLLFFSNTTPAFLLPEKGIVEVNSGSGFVAYTTQTEVDENDIIRTGADSSAVLIIYESVLITIEPNTQLSIGDLATDNLQIKQQSGSTWNKFTKLNGVTGYTLQTPTSVAAVRGTEFGLNNERLIVAEGTVQLESNGQTITVYGDEKADIGKGGPVKEKLSEKDIDYMINHLEIQTKQLQSLRARELKKHASAVKLIQTKLKNEPDSYTVDQMLEAADNGEIDLTEAKTSVVIKAEWVDNVFDLTRKIQVQRAHVTELRNKKE